jgi:Domain of unknown function (DUF4262)
MTDLPDFHIPHSEKIEWMIEEHGWAIEPVAAQPELDPPVAGYIYTIGFPIAFDFPEVVLFGLTPAAARGLYDLLADLLRGGTEIPLGVEFIGLLDNDLRCVFATAGAWYRGAPFDVVQLLWPDRNGFLPTEPGFDRRLLLAQPVIGMLAE